MEKSLACNFPNGNTLVALMGGKLDLVHRYPQLEKSLPYLNEGWCKQLMEQELAAKKKLEDEAAERLSKINISEQAAEPGRLIAEMNKNTKLYLNETQNADSLIQKVRAMYPGEAVIFMVWTTWGEDCTRDLKDLSNAQAYLKEIGINLVCLGVNENSTQELWKRRIEESQVAGDHIWLEIPIAASIIQQYGQDNIPAYLFFDRKGKYHHKVIEHLDQYNLSKLKHILN